MRPGQLHKQPDLARTFRALVEGGPDVYYRGEIADKIVSFCQAEGGLLTKEDMADLTVEWVDPLGITTAISPSTARPPLQARCNGCKR